MAMTITKDNFTTDVINSGGKVLIDFWAPWCGPCRMIAPIIEEISENPPEGVLVGKVNVDEEPELAAKYGVMSIPTLLVIKNGEVAAQAVGVKPKQAILNLIDEA